jgi:hypothetical protein
MISRSLQVVDAFYNRPEDIRQCAMSMIYKQPTELAGWRTQGYHPRGIKRLIETKFRVTIKYWEKDLGASEACNGVFFTALSNGTHAGEIGVHYDDPANWMMLVVYLTPDAPFDAGTSTWQHRATNLCAKPTRKDAVRLGWTLKALEAKLSKDSYKSERWIEIDRIGNVFNRAVMFPGGLFHSATRHFGSDRQSGRVYQTFHFPTV